MNELIKKYRQQLEHWVGKLQSAVDEIESTAISARIQMLRQAISDLTSAFPSGTVVLSPAERDEEMALQQEERKAFEQTIADLRHENASLQKQIYARCEFCTERIRKDTAREILQRLADECGLCTLLELKTKYGVEVKL